MQNNLIDLIYQAVEDADKWLEFLTCLLTHPRFQCAAVGYQNHVNDSLLTGFLQGPEPDQIEAFYDKALHGDPFAPHRHALHQGIFGLIGSRLLAIEERETSNYYAWMADNGVDEVLLVGNRLPHDAIIHLPVFIPQGCTPTSEDMALLKSLMPHITNAFRLSQRIAELEAKYTNTLHALETFRVGCILINDQGQVEWLNMYAQHLLEQGSSLQLIDHELYTVPQNQNVLEFISKLSPKPAQALQIPPSLEVRVSPLSTFGHPFISTSQGLLLMVADTNYLDQGLMQRLIDLYGMSHAEAEVTTWLILGYTLENISHILNKSLHTVRHQIKQAMRKCQVNSQAQLVALIHRGLACLT